MFQITPCPQLGETIIVSLCPRNDLFKAIVSPSNNYHKQHVEMSESPWLEKTYFLWEETVPGGISWRRSNDLGAWYMSLCSSGCSSSFGFSLSRENQLLSCPSWGQSSALLGVTQKPTGEVETPGDAGMCLTEPAAVARPVISRRSKAWLKAAI